MTVSTSRLAYEDCFDLMDRALNSAKGTRVKFDTNGDAMYFRTRLHKARSIDREDNAILEPRGSYMHGRSIYDTLVARILHFKGSHWLYLEKYSLDGLHIEDIDDNTDEPDGETHPLPTVAEMIDTGEKVSIRRRF